MTNRFHFRAVLIPALFMATFLIHSTEAVILDDQGQILPEVIDIFQLFSQKFQHPDLIKNPTLKNLNLLAQHTFLRPHPSERLSAVAIAHYQKLMHQMTDGEKQHLLHLFWKLGDVGPVFPKIKKFDYILLNGSTVPNMRERIASFCEALIKGHVQLMADTKIIFLEGERPLFASENQTVLLQVSPYTLRPGWTPIGLSLPTDEREAARWVWNQMQLPTVLLQKQYEPVFVDAEKKPQATRAETEDCVKKWAQTDHPKPNGTALVVSNNPYVYYQKCVTQKLLAQSGLPHLRLDTLGNAITESAYPNDTVKIGVLLDTLARNLHLHSME